MTETPKCPYCGAEMIITHAFVSNSAAAHKMLYTCFCRECGIYTPKRSTPEEALSAALHRAEPEMKPLTIEETQKQSETENVVWLEMVDDLNAMEAKVAQIDPANPRCFVYTLFNHFVTRKEDYGKTWRCWPRKPTPEQMAATKWEEDKTK